MKKKMKYYLCNHIENQQQLKMVDLSMYYYKKLSCSRNLCTNKQCMYYMI